MTVAVCQFLLIVLRMRLLLLRRQYEFPFGINVVQFSFSFQLVSVILFFNAVIYVLFYLGVIQAVINYFGRFLAFCLETGPVESIAAAANIFVSLVSSMSFLYYSIISFSVFLSLSLSVFIYLSFSNFSLSVSHTDTPCFSSSVSLPSFFFLVNC